jgi:hypothetical protein
MLREGMGQATGCQLSAHRQYSTDNKPQELPNEHRVWHCWISGISQASAKLEFESKKPLGKPRSSPWFTRLKLSVTAKLVTPIHSAVYLTPEHDSALNAVIL